MFWLHSFPYLSPLRQATPQVQDNRISSLCDSEITVNVFILNKDMCIFPLAGFLKWYENHKEGKRIYENIGVSQMCIRPTKVHVL